MTGKSSKFPINRLAANYMAVSEDPELLSLRDPLAIVTVRIQELLEKIDAEEAQHRQQEIQRLFEEYRFYRGRNEEKADEAFERLDREMARAYDEYKAYEQLFQAIDVRRKLSESEVKRLKEMRQFITKEEAYKFLAKVQAAILKVLGEHPRLLKALQYEIIRLTGDGDSDVLGRRGDTGGEVLEAIEVDTRPILDS